MTRSVEEIAREVAEQSTKLCITFDDSVSAIHSLAVNCVRVALLEAAADADRDAARLRELSDNTDIRELKLMMSHQAQALTDHAAALRRKAEGK